MFGRKSGAFAGWTIKDLRPRPDIQSTRYPYKPSWSFKLISPDGEQVDDDGYINDRTEIVVQGNNFKEAEDHVYRVLTNIVKSYYDKKDIEKHADGRTIEL